MKPLFVLTLALAITAACSADVAPTAPATTSFHVKVSGRGQPMVLIPGLATPGDVWDSTVARFGARYECHVISLAGFGGTPARSAAANSAPLLGSVRDELAEYLRRTRLERPVIVGHSLGGVVALDLAARHPELVGPLVIVDSLPFLFGVMQPGATPDAGRQAAAQMAHSFSRMTPETYAQTIRGGPNGSTMATNRSDVERVIAWGLASDANTVATAMTELYSTDLRPSLPQIDSPTLALAAWVGYAPYASRSSIEQIYRAQYAGLENTRIEITDTARHFIMLDQPEWMFDRIESFLAARP